MFGRLSQPSPAGLATNVVSAALSAAEVAQAVPVPMGIADNVAAHMSMLRIRIVGAWGLGLAIFCVMCGVLAHKMMLSDVRSAQAPPAQVEPSR